MKTFAKIYRNVITTMTIVVIVICSALIGPKLFGINPYIVLSGSMEPVIPTGALVYINTKDRDADVNDIVAYTVKKSSGKDLTVTHRVVEKDSNGLYTTKGDANEEKDASLVQPNQIVGTYSYHIPGLGFIYQYFNAKVLIIIAAAIAILNLLIIVFNELAKKGEDESVFSADTSDMDSLTAHPTQKTNQ